MMETYRKPFILGIVCILVILTACNSGQGINRDVSSATDLSCVNIDGIVPGRAIKDVDLSGYTATFDEAERNENAYYFEELRVKTNADGIIEEIQGNIYGYIDNYNAVLFSVNGKDNPRSIGEVTELLGSNHNEYWLDREQKIKAHTYYDDGLELYATFAYDYNSGDLVWVILSK